MKRMKKPKSVWRIGRMPRHQWIMVELGNGSYGKRYHQASVLVYPDCEILRHGGGGRGVPAIPIRWRPICRTV